MSRLLLLSTLPALLCACIPDLRSVGRDETAIVGLPYNEARAAFSTRLVRRPVFPDGELADPPRGSLFVKTRYPAALGRNVALLARPDRAAGDKLPALIWARGGHGGLGAYDDWIWDDHDYLGDALRLVASGRLIVFVPSWRGDNDNPGDAELFLGEVDDAAAAIAYVRTLPGVDPDRVYLAGHSTGGTLAVLASIAAKPPLRATFSFGGVMDMSARTAGQGYEYAPFDQSDPAESYIRSPVRFAREIVTPVYYFAGDHEPLYASLAQAMVTRAANAGVPYYAYTVTDGDHWNYVPAVMAQVVAAIDADIDAARPFRFDAARAEAEFRRRLARGLAEPPG